jgi:hypothetical protein
MDMLVSVILIIYEYHMTGSYIFMHYLTLYPYNVYILLCFQCLTCYVVQSFLFPQQRVVYTSSIYDGREYFISVYASVCVNLPCLIQPNLAY